jgi:hypothetical protein
MPAYGTQRTWASALSVVDVDMQLRNLTRDIYRKEIWALMKAATDTGVEAAS